jgi:Flp pilus assembly protein TadD
VRRASSGIPMTQLTVDEAAERAVYEYEAGNREGAEEICRQILEVKGDHGVALQVMGAIAVDVGRFELGEELLISVVRMYPGYAEACFNLGRAREGMGNVRGAIEAYRAAVEIEPKHAAARNGLGMCLYAVRECEAALEQYRKAMELRPDAAEVPNNMGNALQGMGRAEESLEWYRRALELRPTYAEAYSNMASALRDMKRFEEAIEFFDKAIAIKSDYAGAHRNRALTLLAMGRLKEGFEAWEWRWVAPGFNTPRRKWDRPTWEGEDLGGKTILLHHEQGAGDAFQFARYVPMVKARGAGSVVVETLAGIEPVMETVKGVERVVTAGKELGEFDVQLSLLSLPRVFGTTLETIPKEVPYLSAPADRKEKWARRMGARDGRLRVGVIWSGNMAHPEIRRRRMSLGDLAPLGKVKDVALYSLQKDGPARELANTPEGLVLEDLSGELGDFGDTAAAMEHLDLVISTDTSTPHLAGAMGKKVWVMLETSPDWRWLMDRGDSPWYPTMRLFRQKVRGEWGSVVGEVVEALGKMTRG